MNADSPCATRRPVLSVVVAARLGWPCLDACLASLGRQDQGIEAEVIVAEQKGSGIAQSVGAKYPQVRLVEVAGRRSVFELRAAGILAARGDIVALTADYCTVPAGWCERIVCAHATHAAAAIGGAVDNAAAERTVDWAAYFCEYSRFSSPLPGGAVPDLPVPNVSYKRSALDAWRAEIAPGYRETLLHRRMEAAGWGLWSDPSIVVQYNRHYRFREFLAGRFHSGRWLAGARRLELGGLRRLLYVALCPLLPAWLLARIARQALRGGRRLREFGLALPLVAVFVVAGAVGEVVGGLWGPGESAFEMY